LGLFGDCAWDLLGTATSEIIPKFETDENLRTGRDFQIPPGFAQIGSEGAAIAEMISPDTAGLILKPPP